MVVKLLRRQKLQLLRKHQPLLRKKRKRKKRKGRKLKRPLRPPRVVAAGPAERRSGSNAVPSV